MSDGVDAILAGHFGDRLRRMEPIAPMTTYRVGGPATWYVEAADVEDLTAIAQIRGATGIPVLVVGKGSNMLVSDRGFDGLVVRLGRFAEQVDIPACSELGDEVVITMGGAAALPVAARKLAAAGIEGFEWAVGIPGTVGGATRMNAGGHGADMASVIIDAAVFDVDASDPSDAVETLSLDRLGLRYRASDLRPGHVVVRARVLLHVGERERAEARISEIVSWRRAHQPGGQNCGSVFANPVPGEVAAAAIIDGLGLRGYRLGTAQVSPKHANFIQADEGGSGDDVRALMEEVRRRVRDATGYLLRSEVRLVGFDDVDPLSFADPVPVADVERGVE